MNGIIQVTVIIAILLIRFIIKMARKQSGGTTFNSNPPVNNGTMKQPPPYNPSNQQQSNDVFANLFNDQKASTASNASNPFSNTPTPPSFSDPFDEKQDAFSNIPKHNTSSNMGVGSQNYYCMYCGKKFQSTAALKMDTCFKHPKSEQGLQKHVLYTGAGKPNIGF